MTYYLAIALAFLYINYINNLVIKIKNFRKN